MLGWAVKNAGGNAGPYFAHDYKADALLANSMGLINRLTKAVYDADSEYSLGGGIRRNISPWKHGRDHTGSS